MKKKILSVIFVILFFLFSIGIPYLIQFNLNFLGAKLVTFKDVISLWIITPIFVFLFLIYSWVYITKEKF